MQDTLHAFPPAGRLRALPHVVDSGRFRPSRADALQEAHASLQAAEENLHAGARHAFGAQLYWPGSGWVPPDELVLRRLLPMAHEGLRDCGVSTAARERYLDIIERRCVTRRTGSSWQRDTVARLEDRGLARDEALVAMLHRYIDHMSSGEPVHTWPLC